MDGVVNASDLNKLGLNWLHDVTGDEVAAVGACVPRAALSQYVSKDQEIPGGLAQKIEHFIRKAANRNEQLRRKEKEKLRINGQFDSDLERYRFLKGIEQERELKKKVPEK